MKWWKHLLVDAALAAVAAAAAVIGPELVAGAAALKTIEAIWTVEEIIKTGAVFGAIANHAAQAAESHHASAYGTSDMDQDVWNSMHGDPFDSPDRPPKIPKGPTSSSSGTSQGTQTDGKGPEKGGGTETETELERRKLNPLIEFSPPPGDYQGIQKTMYDPPTGNILGLKFLTRTHRGSIHSTFRHVSHLIRRTGARVRSVKPTNHSPVRPHGQIWDSAFRP